MMNPSSTTSSTNTFSTSSSNWKGNNNAKASKNNVRSSTMVIILISLIIAYVICLFVIFELAIGNFQRQQGRIGLIFHHGGGSTRGTSRNDSIVHPLKVYSGSNSHLIDKLLGFNNKKRTNEDLLKEEHNGEATAMLGNQPSSVELKSNDNFAAAAASTTTRKDKLRLNKKQQVLEEEDRNASVETTDSTNKNNNNKDGSNTKGSFQWEFDVERIQRVQKILQQKTSRSSPILTAYVEGPAAAAAASSSNTTTTTTREPLRTQTPNSLQSYQYRQVMKCSDMPTKFPVIHPREVNHIYRNVHNTNPIYKTKMEYATYCPVDADPYLPWIHDVFPSSAKNVNTNVVVEYVEFIAQNKRRCNTDAYREKDTDKDERFIGDLENLKPQVAIMQPVPIKRISHDEALTLAPQLWSQSQQQQQQQRSLHPSSNNDTTTSSNEVALQLLTLVDSRAGLSRYRLATYEDADSDSRETRFICRFHTIDFGKEEESTTTATTTLRKVILGETLSVYPYNYEFANWHKDGDPMLSRGGMGANNAFWNSVIHFRCPIPSHLQSIVGHERSVVNDVATIYLDLIPIRTRVRLKDEEYFTEEMVGSSYVKESTFNPMAEWGNSHVLPEVEASGRWANIPLCASPMPGRSPNDVPTTADVATTALREEREDEGTIRKQMLIGCVWASAQFTTRGNSPLDTSTSSRLLEWLTFHLYIANMDHIYVYDNSGAHTNEVSLANITNMFPRNRVTRIDWPFQVCNNNIPAHWNTGERSSQYAAEASCRIRYGPHTEFLASFDTDEYLTPMGNWADLKQWLTQGVSPNTNILSFYSSKASANYDFMKPYWDGEECGINETDAKCVIQRPDALFIETYNCDINPLPKPDWAERAKKQIYRPSYVLNHYVHYSTVTRGTVMLYAEAKKRNISWPRYYHESEPSERRIDDLKEATMIHAKSTLPQETREHKVKCHKDYKMRNQYDKCRVGFAQPLDWKDGDNDFRASDGFKYNCYPNPRLVKEFIPKLRKLLDSLHTHTFR